jgi:sugar fermentation stimulation protein A
MLLALPPLLVAAVEARPSKTLKSPYVADVCVDSTAAGETLKGMCHSPGLGCSGLVAPGRSIWVSVAATGGHTKTQWTARLAQCVDSEGSFLVGIHPLDCQKAAAELLDGLLTPAQGVARWASEVCIDAHTRIDYVGTLKDNKKVYVEVKTAMISHETEKPRAERRAIFPEGFRRSAKDTVSPRAVKHCETLAALTERPDTAASILLFVVPRTDCEAGLCINPADPIYCAAVRKAIRCGVEVRVVGLRPTLSGLLFDRELPFHCP